MRGRRLKLLLLATFVFWATGAAQFAHERIDHCSEAVLSQSIAGLGVTVLADAAHSHGHEDCAVCGTFASMAAHHAVANPPVVRPQLCRFNLSIPDRAIPTGVFELFLRSRAPPTDAAFFPA